LFSFTYRYAYQSYIQNAFYTSQEYKDTALSNVGFFGDQTNYFEDVFATVDDIKKSESVLSRWELISDSKWVDLTGPIYIPFFDSENLLLNNMNLDIELVRNNPEFILYDQTVGVNYKIEIRNPS